LAASAGGAASRPAPRRRAVQRAAAGTSRRLGGRPRVDADAFTALDLEADHFYDRVFLGDRHDAAAAAAPPPKAGQTLRQLLLGESAAAEHAEPEAPAASGDPRTPAPSKRVFTRAEADRILKKVEERGRQEKNLFQGMKEEDPKADEEAMALLFGGKKLDAQALLAQKEAEAASPIARSQSINNPYKLQTGGGGSSGGGVADALSRAQQYRSGRKTKLLQNSDDQFNSADVEGLVATSGREQSIMDKETGRLQAEASNAEDKVRQNAANRADLDEAKKEFPDLLAMTEVERADVVDRLTRKAFALMEAGEVTEATTYLNRASKVVAVFKNLEDTIAAAEELEETEPLSWEKDLDRMKAEGEILTKLRRELHKDDFQGIFGGKYNQWIGGF